ncbi:sortase [Patescibacteria group bacterium]|nr:sortase [Patescibacteria group bacterium]
MNPIKKQKKDTVPENLPIQENQKDSSLVVLRISKNKLKKISQILIILIILLVSAPRIIDNVSDTLGYVQQESKKFPVVFPALTFVGTSVSSFVYEEVKNAFSFTMENLASVAEILYTRKLTPEEVEKISNGSTNIIEEKAEPVRIIIDDASINSIILNPQETDITVLEEALKLGVVRYPGSGLLGENNNIYLFGHSTSYEIVRNQVYKSLNGLGNLKKGATIRIQSLNKEYIYRVTSVTMQKNSDAIVRFNTGKKTLTISTCNTLGSKEDRYIVEADYITSYPITLINDSQNNTTVTVTNKKSPTIPAQPVKNQTTQQHQYTEIPITLPATTPTIAISNPYGKVDLTAKITEVGILDSETKTFIATSTLKTSNKIAFKFIVTNLGDKEINDWRFNAVLPTDPFYIYHSNTQNKLGPGESIEFSIGFDKPRLGEGTIIVNIDPAGEIFEKNEDNNIIKKSITIVE